MPAAVVFCNPILDIVVGCDGGFLERRKLVAGAYTEYLPEVHTDIYEEALRMPDHQLIAGGSGQNTARMLERIIGEEVAFVGCVGGTADGQMDDHARKMDAVLKRDHPKIRACYDIHPGTPTGVCCVCITGAQRSLCTNLGATAKLSRDHVDRIKTLYLLPSSVVYVTGFFVTANPDAMLDVCRSVQPQQVLVIALPPPFLLAVPRMWTVLEQCLALARCVVSNREEWLAYHKLRTGQASEDVVEILKSWCVLSSTQQQTRPLTTDASSTSSSDEETESPIALAICTDGADCVHAVATVDGAKTFKQLMLPVKPYAGTIVDSNGCGDAFIASILASLHRLGLRTLCDVLGPELETACACGAFELSKPGFGVPSRAELEALLPAQPAN